MATAIKLVFETYSQGSILQTWGPRDNLGPTFYILRQHIHLAEEFEKSCEFKEFQKQHKVTLYLINSTYLHVGGGGVILKEEKQQNKRSNQTSCGILENINDPVDANLYQTLKAKDNRIINIKRIYNKGKPTSAVKLTFSTPIDPIRITTGFYMEIKPCRILIRCNNCQKHGHKTQDCKEATKCPHCAGSHSHNQCKKKNSYRQLLCANCMHNHGAYSKSCPVYQQYKAKIDAQKRDIYSKLQMRKAEELQTAAPKTQSDTQHMRVTKKPEHTLPLQANTQINSVIEQEQPSDDNTYITKDQLKNILLELFENQQIITSDKTTKLSFIENTIDKHAAPHKPTAVNRPLVATLNISPVGTPNNNRPTKVPRHANQYSKDPGESNQYDSKEPKL